MAKARAGNSEKCETKSGAGGGVRGEREGLRMKDKMSSNLEQLTRESKKLIDSRKLEKYTNFFGRMLPVVRLFYYFLDRFGWRDKRTLELFKFFDEYIDSNRRLFQELTENMGQQAKSRVNIY